MELLGRLSEDFELVGNHKSKPMRVQIAKNYLKALDSRQAELGLSCRDARKAAQQFKRGEFGEALETIWGHKLHVERQKVNDTQEVITYCIDGWGIYTERICCDSNRYVHTIQATYVSNPAPSFDLTSIHYVECKRLRDDFISQCHKADMAEYKDQSTAKIYNTLFVGYDASELNTPLSHLYLRFKNEL